jgi:DNA-directed RNA polymerase subunit M/transcription elongation factor TFIIS
MGGGAGKKTDAEKAEKSAAKAAKSAAKAAKSAAKAQTNLETILAEEEQEEEEQHAPASAHAPEQSAAAQESSREVIYIRYDDTNMKYVYLCVHCDMTWRTDNRL